MYAYVMYLRDGIKKVVPVEDIRGFEPKDCFDVDNNHYKVLWRGRNDEIPREKAARYSAQVLRLGESEEELRASIASKRTKIPKRLDFEESTECSDSEEETQFDTNIIPTSQPVEKAKKRTQKGDQHDAERARLEAILGHDRSRDSRLNMKENMGELQEAKKRIAALEKELQETSKEVTLLRRLNYAMQTEVITTVRRSGVNDHKKDSRGVDRPSGHKAVEKSDSRDKVVQPKIRPQPAEPSQKRNASTPPPSRPEPCISGPADDSPVRSADYKLDIREDIREHIRGQKNASMMAKALAVAVWGSGTLSQRSVYGRICNNIKKEPKPCLTPKKINAIKEEVSSELKRRGAPPEAIESEVQKVPHYLNQKIQDLNRKAKKARCSSGEEDGAAV